MNISFQTRLLNETRVRTSTSGFNRPYPQGSSHVLMPRAENLATRSPVLARPGDKGMHSFEPMYMRSECASGVVGSRAFIAHRQRR